MKTGILLINLGTPDSPSTRDVRIYLRELLSCERVIDINPVIRWFVLNFLILPFRPRKSAKAYKKNPMYPQYLPVDFSLFISRLTLFYVV